MKKIVLHSVSRNKRKPDPNETIESEIDEQDFKDGWLNVDKYLPDSCELVLLKKDFFSKPAVGWRSGENWFGLRVKDNEDYIYWKFLKERL